MTFASNHRNGKRTYDSDSEEPFKISRSKIDMFLQCPRCFYLEQRLGVGRPSMPGFALNSAVDHLLKKEFDIHRAKGTAHPLMQQYGLDAIPFEHEDMDQWRHNFTGVRYHHPETNLLVFGAVDDVWQDSKTKELYIVDYKSTSTSEEITLDGKWKEGYKRQMEVYQWLMSRNGFDVSPIGYFVYVNGRKDREAFDGKLEFSVQLIPYRGDNSWVEPTLLEIKKCLEGKKAPAANEECEYCAYRDSADKVLA